jgi:putative transposase
MVNDHDRVNANRSHPAHLPNLVRFNKPVILFVTVCAADRLVNTFANLFMHRILIKAWGSATSYTVGAYMLMPDHIHLFCAPTSPEAENVAKWVRYWKSLVTRAVRRTLGGASVCLPADEQTLVPPLKDKTQKPPIFQRDCWDTQLRRGENYHEKWEYVRNNPVRRGLVTIADEWPFGGILNDLLW